MYLNENVWFYQEPMDFSTMNEKIEENKYENLNQFR